MGDKRLRLQQTSLQRDPAQDLLALIIYLKNMTALKGQEGIYGLGIGVLWSWKESQRFYGPVGFFFLSKETFSFFVKENLCQIPIDDRVINTELPSLKLGLDDFSQMSWSSPCTHSSHKYLLGTESTAGPVLSSRYNCGQNSFCPGAHWFSILAVL